MPTTETAPTVGSLIRGAMVTHGIRQQDLAAALDISQVQVSQRLRGVVEWRLSELRIVADLTHIDITQLFDAPLDARAGA